METTTTLTITLANTQYRQVQCVADQLGVSTEDLVRISIETAVAAIASDRNPIVSTEDLVRISIETFMKQPTQDIHDAIAYILKKNADLYRRLA